MEFKGFDKISRLSREAVITEKIDGTNASVLVELKAALTEEQMAGWPHLEIGDLVFAAASRTQWISPQKDNHGFAKWAYEHAEELAAVLGPGQHFGEWWGSGIQRGYGLTKGEKRFSLFNRGRWDEGNKPGCCEVVPIISQPTTFKTEIVDACLDLLQQQGSFAAPGFMKPEGVVVFHTASGTFFKKTIEKDEVPKGFVK